MAFERSPSGQANRALFFDVDYTCYVEGIPGENFGIDIAFWSETFSALPGGPSIHFVSRGGKPILEQLANQLVEEDISNTIVAMDRDYSPFRENRFIDHPKVFYTHGYSWENDVFERDQVVRVAARVARTANLPDEHRDELYADLERLKADVGRYVFADFVAILKGGSVFQRSKPGRYVQRNASGRPALAIARCAEDFKETRNRLANRDMRAGHYNNHEPLRYFWGKGYEHYIRLGILRTVKNCANRSCSHDHLRDVAIGCFAHCLATGQNSEVLDHYREMWDRFLGTDA